MCCVCHTCATNRLKTRIIRFYCIHSMTFTKANPVRSYHQTLEALIGFYRIQMTSVKPNPFVNPQTLIHWNAEAPIVQQIKLKGMCRLDMQLPIREKNLIPTPLPTASPLPLLLSPLSPNLHPFLFLPSPSLPRSSPFKTSQRIWGTAESSPVGSWAELRPQSPFCCIMLIKRTWLQRFWFFGQHCNE